MANRPHYVVKEIDMLIRDKLMNGSWKPGDEIPSESVLQKEPDYSRGSVRKSIRYYRWQGILITHQGKPTFVSRYFRPCMLEHVYWTVTPLNRKEFESMLAFRQVTERLCARLAALNATDEDIKVLDLTLTEMQGLQSDHKLFSLVLCEFHFAIIRGSHNEAFIRALYAIKNMYYDYFSVLSHTDISDSYINACESVVLQIKNKNPDAAEVAMHKLIELAQLIEKKVEIRE